MAIKEFPSKVDAWLAAVLVLTMLAQVAFLVWMLFHSSNGTQQAVVVVVSLVVILLILSIMIHTRYRILDGVLSIVSGPFRWKVPIAQIDSIEESRNPLSSPALSLDRLQIRYDGKKKILVSPADKKGFIKALQQ